MAKYNDEKTKWVEKCLNDLGLMEIYRTIYFKTCLIRNVKPRFKEFCILLDLRFFVTPGGHKVWSNEKSLDAKHLDGVIQDLFKAWKRCPFSADEMQIIRQKGIGSGVQVILNSDNES